MYDLYCFWYTGQYIRQGDDPFEQFGLGVSPVFPIAHIDGGISTGVEPLYEECTQFAPAYTAPMMLLYTLPAFFSWHIAASGFRLLMLGLVAVLAVGFYLYFRPFVKQSNEKWLFGLIIVIVFAFSPIRSAVYLGQPNIIVLLLIVVALLAARRNWDWAAGVALGIALSKYQMALPVAVLFLLQRRWLALIVAAVVQAFGIALLSALVGISPLTMVQHYIESAGEHALKYTTPIFGVHLASFLPNNLFNMAIVFIGLTLLLATAASSSLRRLWVSGRRSSLDTQRTEMLILALLTGWSLLGVYHLLSDSSMLILMLVPFILVLTNDLPAGLSSLERAGFELLLLASFYMIFPEYVTQLFVIDLRARVHYLLFAFFTAALTAVVVLLLRRLERRTRALESVAAQPSGV